MTWWDYLPALFRIFGAPLGLYNCIHIPDFTEPFHIGMLNRVWMYMKVDESNTRRIESLCGIYQPPFRQVQTLDYINVRRV